MEYLDIGVNLFDRRFEGKQNEVVERSANTDIGLIITGCSIGDSIMASDYVKERDNTYSTAGIHPHNARFYSEETFQALLGLIQNNSRVLAVGECGLDYDRMFSPIELQKICFEKQIVLAEMTGKPLFLHERKAAEDFYNILKQHRKAAEKSVVHCFTGTKESAMNYIGLGCHIGITGWICDDARNTDLLEAIKYIPLERIMIETDSPYLTPKEVTGNRRINYPWNLPHICNRVAKEKNLSPDAVKKTVYENTIRFFNIEKQPAHADY